MFGICLIIFSCIQGLILTSVSATHSDELTPEEKSLVRFLVWTRGEHSADSAYEIINYNDIESMLASSFDGSKKTFIHFHGFTNNGTMQWILTSKTGILQVEDANILSVDYGGLVPPPEINYFKSVKIMYLVAKHVALFVDWLSEQTSLTTSQLHFIGHSLGAHNAGMTAKNVKSGRIERITGLDPASPQFENASIEKRLDKSQAKFVDIIHTNACIVGSMACRGIYRAIGHVDFYPNGGKMQPGCANIIDDIECSHQRVTDLWNESILNNELKFTSWPCKNSFMFDMSFCTSCGQGCLDMGFYLNTKLEGTYYLSTNTSSPYAKGDQQH